VGFISKKINTEYLFLLFALVFTIVSVVVLFSVFLDQDEKIYDYSSEIVGTKVQQTVYGDSAQKASRAAEKQMDMLFSQISWWNNGSQIKKVNDESRDGWVSVSSGVLSIMIKGLEVAHDSKGAYDPTMLPILSIWRSCFESRNPPSNGEILEKMESVDYKRLKINKEVLKVRIFGEGTFVDLGPIADGAACSAALKQYQENGASAGIVRVGNSVGVWGNKKDNSPFRVNILHPFKRNEGVNFAFLEVKDGCVCTVDFGDNSFQKDGKFFHGVIDPFTGFPTNNELASVTVVHHDGVLASALARACFVLGKEQGVSILKKYGAGGIFIDKQKRVLATEDVEGALEVIDI
jgi:thiamine biosynthesis lipoprotein